MKFKDFDAAVYKKCSGDKRHNMRAMASLATAAAQPVPGRRTKMAELARKVFELAPHATELMDKLDAERRKILADRGMSIVDDESDLASIFSDDSLMSAMFSDDSLSSFSADSGDVEYLAAIRQYQAEFDREREALEAGIISEDRFADRAQALEQRAFGEVEVAIDYDPVTGRPVPYAAREGFIPRQDVTGAAVPAPDAPEVMTMEEFREDEETGEVDEEEVEFAFTGGGSGPRLAVAPAMPPASPDRGEGAIDIPRAMTNPFVELDA